VVSATALLALAYGARTTAQNRVWRNELTLFADQARTAPESAKAHAQYGNALVDVGRDREAIAQYERSLEIYVYKPDVYFELGNALGRVRADPQRRIEAYRGAIRLMPGHLEARAALARTWISIGRIDEARAEIEEISARDPSNGDLPALRKQIAAASK
jgi:tetratricopeptide (TPR) repeat protein